LLSLHQPSDNHESELLLKQQHPAQRRLIFDELLAHHLAFLQIRENALKRKANPIQIGTRLAQEFERNLEYELTDAQQRVLLEIRQDLTASTPMMRLLQGDVGSGKTIVALLSSLQVAEKGYQTALMAPTELLAEQHYRYFSEELLPLGIQVVWLTSSLKRKQRNEALELIASGTALVVVGTHALFQDEVKFQHLALCITDEQHRFGVHQRMTLSQKGLLDQCHPHQLIMTATPIPRTLAMSMYAHLDHSIIDQMPPGRQPIQTVAIADSRRAQVIERIQQACAAGAQVYWVCSLIEESETLRCQTATETYENLCQQLHGFSVGLVHGKLPSQEKNQTMQDFAQQKVQVLVATTVIEVGVNVPNATLMVIENAERFGLAQLHQLRGRVGRGRQQSSCVLMYTSPLGEYAKKRIDALRKSTDGFKLAAVDLELRGPGEVLGTKQSGDVRLRMADLVKDAALLPEVQRCAQWLMREHPERVPLLAQRWLGKAAEYARA
jgi:ATP-dependent DNA helicase RecG